MAAEKSFGEPPADRRGRLEWVHRVASAPMGELAMILACGVGLRAPRVLAMVAALRAAADVLEKIVKRPDGS